VVPVVELHKIQLMHPVLLRKAMQVQVDIQQLVVHLQAVVAVQALLAPRVSLNVHHKRLTEEMVEVE
jgi:hypothetical protein